MKLNSIFFLFTISIFALSCHKKSGQQEPGIAEDLVTITHDQFETETMQFGEMQKKIFNKTIHCHGNIISKPKGSAKISTSVSGLVKNIFCTPGQKVTKGQILFEIQGNELIELQRDFAETSSQLARYQSEYERLKSLFSENVGSEKDLIFAESEYKSTLAKYSALKIKLQIIGLETAKIENGNFYESFYIKSPIGGYISQINVSLGQYADQLNTIAEVFDASQLYIGIAVFEKDIPRLKVNQNVLFRQLGDSTEYVASLTSIGKNVDNATKTILCLAEINDRDNARFVNNSFIEARIIASADTVNAVPEGAVLKSGENNYLLSLVNDKDNIYYLKKIKVQPGISLNGWVEILNQPETGRIITKGVYNIQIE